MEETIKKPKMVEVYAAAVYVGRGNDAVDEAAKNLLFDAATYDDWDQHVYTRRHTLYGVDERKNIRIEFGTIAELVYKEKEDGTIDESVPYFKFIVSETVGTAFSKMQNPVIVCTAKVVTNEDGSLRAKKPRYVLYEYQDFLDGEKRKLEKRVFRNGSVVPQQQQQLTVNIGDYVAVNNPTAVAPETADVNPPAEAETQAQQNASLADQLEAFKNFLAKATPTPVV